MTTTERFFISCPKGVELLLEQEFAGFGFEQIKQTVGGIYASAPFNSCYAACLNSRFANRIVWLLVETQVRNKQELYQSVKHIAWQFCFSQNKTFAVDFKGGNQFIDHSNYGGLLIKDAIVDHFTEEVGIRPNVNPKQPDVSLYAHLKRKYFTLGIDVSGGSLHRRGYRLDGAKAPLKENLAAALVARVPAANKAAVFVDPMCGSGTLLIEAMLQRLGIASQLQRQQFGFEHLIRFDKNHWQGLLDAAKQHAETAIAEAIAQGAYTVQGFDNDMRVISAAKENAARANLGELIQFKQQALQDFNFDAKNLDEKKAVMLVNPPYGERLDERNALFSTYQLLGNKIKQCCQGFQIGALSSDELLLKAIGLQKSKSYQFYNGALAAQWLLFDVYRRSADGTERSFVSSDKNLGDFSNTDAEQDSDTVKHTIVQDDKFIAAVEMVANRLRKNKKKLAKWARKNDISCYRLYDADMPEYAFALDIYNSRYQLTEYAAPKTVDSFAAFTRKQHFEKAVCEVFELKPTQLFYKQRRQQKGSSQYEKMNEAKHFFKVQEGSATLYVNLTDYLDTGLFLDHRPVRKLLGEKAKGKNFLNLFSYTSVASVQAILGGAKSSTSVDMSKTYIEWSEKNYRVNKINTDAHKLVRANVIQWLEQAKNVNEWFDLIFLDPPSFSNSKKMDGTLDIQRDQVELITATMELLAEGGELIFSNNRRGFKLEPSLQERYDIKPMGKASIDMDFERNANIHQCFSIRHR